MHVRGLIAALLLAALLGGGTVGAVQAQSCQFTLGFATLHDLLPEIVGECVADEQHNPANGDGLQQTTTGLLVWRKADNFTAFTNGRQSWINGPLGLETRSNDERLWWEWNPNRLPVVPPPQAGERCHSAGLSLLSEPGGAGAGHAGLIMRLTNEQSVPCSLYGYVGALLLDAQYNPLPTTVVRGRGYLFPDPGARLVSLPAGGSATFGLEWGQVPVGEETSCPPSAYLAVTPPDEYAPLIIPATIHACGGGQLHVTAVEEPPAAT